MGTWFSDISIGERFLCGGYNYIKRTASTAVDVNGVVATFSPSDAVQRFADNIATTPDILKTPEPSHETRITRLTITPNKFPLYCESGFNIELMNEAAGEFVQVTGNHKGLMKIDPSEWPILRKAIDRMIDRCRKDDNED